MQTFGLINSSGLISAAVSQDQQVCLCETPQVRAELRHEEDTNLSLLRLKHDLQCEEKTLDTELINLIFLVRINTVGRLYINPRVANFDGASQVKQSTFFFFFVHDRRDVSRVLSN